jgi:twitching motility protein PilJ
MSLNMSNTAGFLGSKPTSGGDTTIMESGDPGSAATRRGPPRLPLLGDKPARQQFQILGVVFLVLLLIVGLLAWRENRTGTHATTYIAATGQMRMLSQRLAKSAQFSLQGVAGAFQELRESRDTFASLLERVIQGGEIEGISVPPSPDRVQPALQTLSKEWEKTAKNATLLLDQEKNLVALGTAVTQINARNPQLLELSEQVAALKLQAGSPAREIAVANQLVMLTQRLAKNANALTAGTAIDPEVTFLLGKDVNTFRDNLQALARGSDTMRVAPASDAETREKLAELEKLFNQVRESVTGILSNQQRLVLAKQAGTRIFADSQALLDATDKVAAAYAAEVSGGGLSAVLMLVFGLLAIGTLILLLRLYNDEARRNATESDRHRQTAEEEKNRQQQAILRLMNEMGDLADGDLTVRATVTEDITGAIADSVNYTVEELSVLVKRINEAASRVTSATESARRTSSDLLTATERQAHEIQEAGASALSMAQSMNEVSRSAIQSAQVARQSLGAAEKGAGAVEDSIKGMNEIRDQIQDTSKRIKRLGESSQEIGEIVELISDITEQTNVLALNAAIQAASAGEAGRGFTVVAEEVQRLAERSGEATKQIAAIVKTIQTDTQDAVLAMERSTRNVVEGAKLSDAAGQALAEISTVSNDLAQLIEQISAQTEKQAAQASRVADTMKSILRVTQQTTAGTKETAVSIGQLAELAVELKGSVSGFKV